MVFNTFYVIKNLFGSQYKVFIVLY